MVNEFNHDKSTVSYLPAFILFFLPMQVHLNWIECLLFLIPWFEIYFENKSEIAVKILRLINTNNTHHNLNAISSIL